MRDAQLRLKQEALATLFHCIRRTRAIAMSSERADATTASNAAAPKGGSLLRPFRHRVFTVIWSATVVSNIGSWLCNAGAGWLMTSLTHSALVIALVQVATSVPMFLFAIPAGALTDIIDKRKFLIMGGIAGTVISAAFTVLVWRHLATPGLVLLFMFLIGSAGAVTMPAWQAVVPKLVPAADLAAAVTANGVGINISRAIGPALAGPVIAALGLAAPFWLNAVSDLATLGALAWWHPPPKPPQGLPAEHFLGAMLTGFRHVRHNPHLRATMLRAAAFFPFAGAYWALLPLVVRSDIAGGPQLYGLLLGSIGVGALGGAFALPRLRAVMGPDWLVAAGTIGTAIALALFGLAREPIMALLGSLIAGAAWILVLSNLNVSAQVALPDWVRGRGLSVFVTVMFAGMALGSGVSGQVASIAGAPLALFLAGAGALLAVPLTWRYKLQTGAAYDLTPATHWPVPIVTPHVAGDVGPVLISIEYRLAAPDDPAAFLSAVYKLAEERGRDGAYGWGLFEDSAEACVFVEVFFVASWSDHLRQHARVTQADRVLQEQINGLLVGPTRIRHLLAAASASAPAATTTLHRREAQRSGRADGPSPPQKTD
jgi:MFS family permease